MTTKLYGVSAAAAVAACLAMAPPAQAQSIGYLSTLFGNIVYPHSSPGGNYGVTSVGTGQYQVTFYGLGNGLNSDVQVNAINTDGVTHYCTAGGWYSLNGSDVTVNVDCFDTSGNHLNDDFSVLYQARTSGPSSGAIAFLWADQPYEPQFSSYTPNANYSYNSTGGTNSVTHENTGVYFAYLPGVTVNGGNPQVTAYGGGAARCQVVDWYHNHSGTNVAVYCVDASGNPADEYFDLSFTFGATQAAGLSTSLGSYAWANKPTAPKYVPAPVWQWNNVSTTRLTDSNISGGTSFLSMYVPSGVIFSSTLGMVTAYGSHGEYCDNQGTGYYGSPHHEVLTLTVSCFNAQGQPLNNDYTATMITPQ